MKILVVDDDAVALGTLTRLLEKEGHQVLWAPCGSSGWELFQKEPVQLILSDWMMPGLDGLDLCRHVRSLGERDYSYFMLLSGVNLGRESLRLAMAAGVDDFLLKPLDVELLLMRMGVAQRILETRRQNRVLKELLPICMYCRRIRDDQDYWQQLEAYVCEQTGSCFSHGICPDCLSQKHPEVKVAGIDKSEPV